MGGFLRRKVQNYRGALFLGRRCLSEGSIFRLIHRFGHSRRGRTLRHLDSSCRLVLNNRLCWCAFLIGRLNRLFDGHFCRCLCLCLGRRNTGSRDALGWLSLLNRGLRRLLRGDRCEGRRRLHRPGGRRRDQFLRRSGGCLYHLRFGLRHGRSVPTVRGHIAQLDAKAGIVQRNAERLILGAADIPPVLLRRLGGGEAAGRGGVFPLEEHLRLEDRHLVGNPQRVQQQPAVGAGQAEPQPLVGQVQFHHRLPIVIDTPFQVFQRVKAGNLVQ